MMRKITVFLLAIVLCLSFGSSAFAQNVLMKSFFIGPFELNYANFNSDLETQLLSELSGLPGEKSFKICGHTDKSGPESFNKVLARKRADVVASKISKILPEASLEIFAKTYKPENNQNVDYRMVEVRVYANPQVIATGIEGSLEKITEKLDALKNGSSSIDLSEIKKSLSSVSQTINDVHEMQISLIDSKVKVELIQLEKSFLNLQGEFKNFEKHQANHSLLNFPMIIVLLLGTIFIFLFFLLRRRTVDENKKKTEVHWTSINVSTPDGVKTFSFKYEKLADGYIGPVNEVRFSNLPKMKDSLKSSLSNYYRKKEDQSPSFVSGGYEKIISELIKSETIVETEK